jgi:SET domain-containing protein
MREWGNELVYLGMEYSVIEAAERTYLFVQISKLENAGKGLFSAIDIYKDEIIAIYGGEIISQNQARLRALKKNDKYFINKLDGTILDSMKSKCLARYANDAAAFGKSAFRNNAKIAMDDDNNVCLVATKNIKGGDEIFCSYGKRYWNNQNAIN